MILDIIVEKKKEEVVLLKNNGVHLPKAYRASEITPPRGFRNALLRYSGVAIIAEAKKASPSKGVICDDFQIENIVNCYEQNGAQAISVLTDENFFQGSLLYLLKARETAALPVLRKDFIIDELQIKEAAVHGSDAILLIAAILDEKQLQDYFVYAKELGMDVLTEVHDEVELEKVLKTESDLIGINNRNLNNFSVDIETTFRLKKMIPGTIPVVSESGLRNQEDIKTLLEEGVAAALIGETLMRAGTDGKELLELQNIS
jgi:indole-3-glycerol phosphate synthase